MARKMAQMGARIVGVDISEKLLDIARRDERAKPLGITYYLADAQNLPVFDGEPFDGVVCNMALIDIPDLEKAVAGIGRILRGGGWFVATITHPCFQIPPGQGYFTKGFWLSSNPNGVRGQVGAHHRMLGTYLNALGNAGLLVENVAELHLPNRDTPPVLLIKCRKIESPIVR